MTHPSGRAQHRRKGHRPPLPRTHDGAIFAGLLLIGAFLVFLSVVLTQQPWSHFAIGYVIAIIALINVFGWQAYTGRHLSNWQQALARIPLRFAGYGTRKGRPIEAAHGQPAARSALMVFLAVSAVLIAAAVFFFVQ